MATDKNKPLTERQRQIVKMTALSKSRKEIASRLGISLKTVDYHFSGKGDRYCIRSKLGSCETAFLTRWAIRNKLITA